MEPVSNLESQIPNLKSIALACVGWALLCSGAFAASPTLDAKESGGKPSAALELKGLIIPFEDAKLSSRSAGVIRMLKEEGAFIHKDEVVVALEDDVEKSAVDIQIAVLDKRKWEVESNKTLRSKGGSSKDEELTILANFKTAEAQLAQAKALLDRRVVRSPFDGVVVRRVRAVGEAVDQYFPVLNVVNLSQVYMETYLPANRLKDVQPGDPVEIRAPDLPGRTFTGRVDFIAPVIDPASGEVRVKILLPNEGGALRSGMSAVGLLGVSGAEARPAAKP
jgi:membrane fusion protein (multidrug efflux system)